MAGGGKRDFNAEHRIVIVDWCTFLFRIIMPTHGFSSADEILMFVYVGNSVKINHIRQCIIGVVHLSRKTNRLIVLIPVLSYLGNALAHGLFVTLTPTTTTAPLDFGRR